MRWILVSAVLGLCACGAPGPVGLPPPPPPDPAFPLGYGQWPSVGPVTDEDHGSQRRLYRDPGRGALLRYVKAHLDARDPSLTTRVDVRQRPRGPDGGPWAYLSFDAATRQRRAIDAETCDLCHAAAGGEGVFTRFPGLAP